VELYGYDGVYKVIGVKYGVEPNQVADIQNNTHQLPHDWSYYVGTSQTGYELDGVGNRKTVIRDGQTETYVTNSVNEYVYVNNKRLMYDRNGNLTQWNGKTLHYNHNNHNNQLVEVTYTENGFDWDWWFRYGVLGRRMTESFSDGLVHHRRFWYDGQMVIYEEADGYKYRYYNGNLIDEVLCREEQFGQQIWYLTDALGSVYVLTDNDGNVVEAYHYSIYGSPKVYAPDGSPRNLTNYDNRILFTSREYIWQLHLYCYRFRWYIPQMGVFSSRDIRKRSSFYRYVINNPILFSDPSGREPITAIRFHLLAVEEDPCTNDIIGDLDWEWHFKCTKNGIVIRVHSPHETLSRKESKGESAYPFGDPVRWHLNPRAGPLFRYWAVKPILTGSDDVNVLSKAIESAAWTAVGIGISYALKLLSPVSAGIALGLTAGYVGYHWALSGTSMVVRPSFYLKCKPMKVDEKCVLVPRIIRERPLKPLVVFTCSDDEVGGVLRVEEMIQTHSGMRKVGGFMTSGQVVRSDNIVLQRWSARRWQVSLGVWWFVWEN